MMVRAYSVFGSLLLGIYGLTAYNGWEFTGDSQRVKVPEEMRRESGWARSSPIWFYGYRGGK